MLKMMIIYVSVATKSISKIELELFEKYQNPIFSINFRVRQLKLKIAKVNLK